MCLSVLSIFFCLTVGTYVTQVIATDKDDPTNGNNARLVFSILQGQPQFSIEIKSGKNLNCDFF